VPVEPDATGQRQVVPRSLEALVIFGESATVIGVQTEHGGREQVLEGRIRERNTSRVESIVHYVPAVEVGRETIPIGSDRPVGIVRPAIHRQGYARQIVHIAGVGCDREFEVAGRAQGQPVRPIARTVAVWIRNRVDARAARDHGRHQV